MGQFVSQLFDPSKPKFQRNENRLFGMGWRVSGAATDRLAFATSAYLVPS